ncbi:MAG: ATP-binding protein [Campylobacteraceae bacterium]|nr:ATP-binding protein [Campylobacteraceae bacterium]
MLLQFSVNNYKSIKDTITFSMATSSKDEGNSFHVRKYELLKSAVIYGANASGKSNFLKAMSFMSSIVLNKSKVIQSTDKLPHIPFRLSTETQDSSSTFEIVCFINDIKYRYGFELDATTVYSEWLYADEKGKESKLFYREVEEEHYVNINKFKEGYTFFDKKNSKINISSNQLFIWKCDQNDGEISKSILNWFSKFNFIDGMKQESYSQYSMNHMKDINFKNEIVSLVKTADIGIDDIVLEEEKMSSMAMNEMGLDATVQEQIEKNGGITKISLNTYHKQYNEKNEEVGNIIFELENEESKGTRKFFSIAAPILNTLREGSILIIDELDASLHPMLTKHLIKLFHNDSINTKNAQLIFATHDTNLLNSSLFRRDQIWLTEKDKYASTNIFSLAQFNDVRKTEDFEKQYIQGKYGGIPYLGKFEF